jgi:serine/threonine protein kinase
MALAAGTNLGPYRIIEVVGRGGMATVYKAFQASLKRFVAIKVLPEFLAEDQGFRARFEQEAVAVASLRHPNILTVYDHGEQDGFTYIVTEFVDGGTLADQLGKPLPVDYTTQILGPIASALDYAHSRGVLHRDLKPSNILVALDGTPVLSDFGLALMMTTSQVRLTQSGTVLGTPEYMAPEQCAGETLTASADIYALGVVGYEMLTGRVPFSAATPAAVLIAQIQNELPPPRTINPAVSQAGESALLKALAKAPSDRFRTASDFVGALTAKAMPAAAASVPAASPRPARRQKGLARTATGFLLRRLAIMAMAIIVLVVAGGGSFLLYQANSRAPKPSASPPPPVLAEGQLLFQAKLDGTGTDLSPSSIFHSDPTSSKLRFPAGAIEFAILQPNADEGANVNFDGLGRYITEVDFSVQPGTAVHFWWIVRTGNSAVGDHIVNIDTAGEGMRLGYFTAGGATVEALSANVALAGLQKGQSLTLSAVVDPPRYAVYLGRNKVIDVTDSRNSPLGVPGFNCGGESGVVRVTGIRIYTIPG